MHSKIDIQKRNAWTNTACSNVKGEGSLMGQQKKIVYSTSNEVLLHFFSKNTSGTTYLNSSLSSLGLLQQMDPLK